MSKGQLNRGSNHTINYAPNNTNQGPSTNEKPSRGIIKVEKMPTILDND